ncbi:PREDICTED: protein FAM150B [Elephantulus edwardii]|uniref:protein FAM150B n=1 Tax=Elephantulus edwardii TaxID=28737 RepID=UPI0003F07568|nr:PREDICTED: protein FAM150B [Elephantulus edwardii]
MSGPKRSVLLGLALLMVTVGPCLGRTDSGEITERQVLLKLIMKFFQEFEKYHSEEYKPLQFSNQNDYTLGHEGMKDYEVYPEEQRVEIVPRDLKTKEKFLKHLTGPISLGPKCRKQFYRIYHNTRDCTISTFYKRCARLLNRLASSPECIQERHETEEEEEEEEVEEKGMKKEAKQ